MIQRPLPSVPVPIVNSYTELVAELDLLISRLQQRLQNFIVCGPGCSSCCTKFAVLPLEAALVPGSAGSSADLRGTGEFCRYLVDNRCAIYPRRPIICRTQGMPIGYLDEAHGHIEVSACPLNFPPSHQFDYEDLLLLDAFNSRLAALNSDYCRAAGIDTDLRLPLG